MPKRMFVFLSETDNYKQNDNKQHCQKISPFLENTLVFDVPSGGVLYPVKGYKRVQSNEQLSRMTRL